MNKPDWIKEIEEREAKASPHWHNEGPYIFAMIPGARPNGEGIMEPGVYRDSVPNSQQVNNAEFAAHARQDIPRLLSALNKALEALEEIGKHICCDGPDCFWCDSDGDHPLSVSADRAIAALSAINNPQEVNHV